MHIIAASEFGQTLQKPSIWPSYGDHKYNSSTLAFEFGRCPYQPILWWEFCVYFRDKSSIYYKYSILKSKYDVSKILNLQGMQITMLAVLTTVEQQLNTFKNVHSQVLGSIFARTLWTLLIFLIAVVSWKLIVSK